MVVVAVLIVQRLCKNIAKHLNLNREDAMDRRRWKKLIKIG